MIKINAAPGAREYIRVAQVKAAEDGKELARSSKHIGGMASQIF
ncbi:MAG TPA: hypothetical protein VLJ17_19455 [Xanthobacteraceae bacterium]|nr:hypothetical protein [Xanthobacteraceae bacterium]